MSSVPIKPWGICPAAQALIESSPCRRDTAYYASVYSNAPRAYVESAISCSLHFAAEARTATARGVNPYRTEEMNLADAVAFELRAAVGRAELDARDAWLAENPGGYAGS